MVAFYSKIKVTVSSGMDVQSKINGKKTCKRKYARKKLEGVFVSRSWEIRFSLGRPIYLFFKPEISANVKVSP